LPNEKETSESQLETEFYQDYVKAYSQINQLPKPVGKKPKKLKTKRRTNHDSSLRDKNLYVDTEEDETPQRIESELGKISITTKNKTTLEANNRVFDDSDLTPSAPVTSKAKDRKEFLLAAKEKKKKNQDLTSKYAAGKNSMEALFKLHKAALTIQTRWRDYLIKDTSPQSIRPKHPL